MSVLYAKGMVAPVAVLVPVPPPRIWTPPTNPLKSVIWDGSLRLPRARAGFSGLWWIKTPNGANGAMPPGIGLGLPRSSSSTSARDVLGDKKPAPAKVPAVAAFSRNARREARRKRRRVVFIGHPSLRANVIPKTTGSRGSFLETRQGRADRQQGAQSGGTDER